MSIMPTPLANCTLPLADNDGAAWSTTPLIDADSGGPDIGFCRFSTYRADRVSVTSALWSGGDWHWRLTGPRGDILADCGGYRHEAECLAVIEALRTNARSARSPLHH